MGLIFLIDRQTKILIKITDIITDIITDFNLWNIFEAKFSVGSENSNKNCNNRNDDVDKILINTVNSLITGWDVNQKEINQ